MWICGTELVTRVKPLGTSRHLQPAGSFKLPTKDGKWVGRINGELDGVSDVANNQPQSESKHALVSCPVYSESIGTEHTYIWTRG